MRRVLHILAPLAVAIVAYFTYVQGYEKPDNFYWDENYHIASAQKYLNGIYFMEPHPPLGKLMIAAGEWLLQPNPITNQFINTDYAKNVTPGFSFAGYRLVPVLCAWLAAIVFYYLLLEIIGEPLWALALSSLYLFDNTLIVHFRGAMLDGIQFLFIAAILLLVVRIRNGKGGIISWILSGVMFAFAVGVKANGALIAPALLLPIWTLPRGAKVRFHYLAYVGAAAIVATVAIWWTALLLGAQQNPKLERDGWYFSSPELKYRVATHDLSPVTVYYFIRDSLAYSKDYVSKVPALNLCKVEENGSYPFFWPLGGRAINYRWTRDGSLVSYLYLQINPATWAIALASILCAGALCAVRVVGQRRSKLPHEDLMILFVFLYATYMAAALSVSRVLYLYHYFIPLLFCFVLGGILFTDLGGTTAALRRNKSIALGGVAAFTFFVFLIYRPLTYYTPLTETQFNRLSLLKLWNLNWLDRGRKDPIARPEFENPTRHAKQVYLNLSGVISTVVYQEWGEAHINRTVDDNPLIVGGVAYPSGFGVHAASSIEFPLKQQFTKFKALVGIPDEIETAAATVQFAVQGDGREIWRSGQLHPGVPAVPVEADVRGVKLLTLSVVAIGNTVDNDHACWLMPELLK